VSEGKHGEPTDEYLVINQAKWLGVAPWDYIGRPDTAGQDCWLIWTQEAIRAEQDAAKQTERIGGNAAKHRPKARR
jgi:hypothetical protein